MCRSTHCPVGRFADPYWTHVTSGAKGLINDLLQVDPDLRLEAGDAISDDWVYRTSGVAEVCPSGSVARCERV